MGRWFIIAGCALIVAGALLHFAPWLFAWFGKLPGDIRIESDRTKVFIPLASMLLVSLVLTILVSLLRR